MIIYAKLPKIIEKQPLEILLDPEDHDIIKSKNWTYVNNRFYCRLKSDTGVWCTMTMLRYLAYLYGIMIDWYTEVVYVDKNQFNNQKSNIFIASSSERVAHSDRSTRHRRSRLGRRGKNRDLPYGVYRTRSGFFQGIVRNSKKLVYIGTFKTCEEACNAVQAYVYAIDHVRIDAIKA